MNPKQLLDTLTKLQDQNETNTDKYIEAMGDYLKSASGEDWNNQHQAIFNSMEKRVRDARTYKWILVALVIITLLGLIGLVFLNAIKSAEIKQNKDLIEFARNATLPLEIVRPGGATKNYLNVKIKKDFGDFPPDQKIKLDRVADKFPSLGRIYELNEANPLKVALDNSTDFKTKLLLSPNDQKDTSVIIGTMEIENINGEIEPKKTEEKDSEDKRQRFNIKDPIPYLDNSSGIEIDFFIYVDSYDKKRDRWLVKFREGNKNWSEVYYREKSDNGKIESPIFLVYQSGWENVYAVNLGVGKPGGDDGKGNDLFAWFVRSYAKRISF